MGMRLLGRVMKHSEVDGGWLHNFVSTLKWPLNYVL